MFGPILAERTKYPALQAASAGVEAMLLRGVADIDPRPLQRQSRRDGGLGPRAWPRASDRRRPLSRGPRHGPGRGDPGQNPIAETHDRGRGPIAFSGAGADCGSARRGLLKPRERELRYAPKTYSTQICTRKNKYNQAKQLGFPWICWPNWGFSTRYGNPNTFFLFPPRRRPYAFELRRPRRDALLIGAAGFFCESHCTGGPLVEQEIVVKLGPFVARSAAWPPQTWCGSAGAKPGSLRPVRVETMDARPAA